MTIDNTGSVPLPPFPSLAQLEDRTHRREAAWPSALASALVVAALLAFLVWPGQYSPESRHYLLSSVAQVLAAVLALCVSLPLVFAGLSKYLPSAGYFIVRSRPFVSFVLFYVLSIIVPLVLLRFECAADAWVDLALLMAAVCLLLILFYVRWVSDRMEPLRHIRLVLARARRGMQHEATDVTATEFSEKLGLVMQFASVACKDGAVTYLDHALEGLLILMLSDNRRDDTRFTLEARDSLLTFARAHMDDEVGGTELSVVIQRTGFHTYGRLGERMPQRVADAVALLLGHVATSSPPNMPSLVAMIALWTLGSAVAASSGEDSGPVLTLAAKMGEVERLCPEPIPLRRLVSEKASTWVRLNAPDSVASFLAGSAEFARLVDSIVPPYGQSSGGYKSWFVTFTQPNVA